MVCARDLPIMNGFHAIRPLRPGINTPLVAFFHADTEDIDIETTARHAVRLAEAGMASLTTQGSNGEAVHLTREERILITSTVRTALDEAGFTEMPVVVGCAAQSVRETIQLCKDAYRAGGDYALVLPPSYYKTAYTTQALIDYFHDVADKSPVPLIIYNYPGAVAGMDLDSDTITQLAKHENIRGCKLTCMNTGKLQRIATATDAATPFSDNSKWMCMGGAADFTLPTLIAGGSGIIAGLGNILPKACVRVFELYAKGQIAEAQKLQAIVAKADWAVIQGGVSGTKTGLETYFGYGGVARRPLPRPSKAQIEQWNQVLKEGIALEDSL